MNQSLYLFDRELSFLPDNQINEEHHVMDDKPSSIIEVAIPNYNCKYVFKVHPDMVVRELFRQILTVCRLDQQKHMNYGLYIPGTQLQKGKYLQEERVLSEYPQLLIVRVKDSATGPQDDVIVRLELIPKTRFVKAYPMGKEKFKRSNTKWQQRLFIDAVRACNLSRVCSMLEQGMDPNFQCRRSGLTPLSLSVEHADGREMVLKLVEKGAHLEYRDFKSLTALHHAAIIGNHKAIQVLLDLGMSPNVRDFRGLTPLYYAASHDVPSECITTLLFNHAILGITDEKDRQEIHQACLFGRSSHLIPMLRYGADLNVQAQNLDTPLHVCVLNDQESCLRLLLRYGASQEIANASGQIPYEVAVLTGRTVLASILQQFSPDNVEIFTEKPVYNRDRRPTIVGPRGALEGLHAVDDADPQPARKLSNGRENTTNPDGTPVHVKNTREPAEEDAENSRKGTIREVTMTRHSNGFGFKIIGSMKPNPATLSEERPATQFVLKVIPDSPAEMVRLLPGDFILEVNGVDVSCASHREVSDLISHSGATVTLKILTGFPFKVSRDGTAAAQQVKSNVRGALQVADRRRFQSVLPAGITRQNSNNNHETSNANHQLTLHLTSVSSDGLFSPPISPNNTLSSPQPSFQNLNDSSDTVIAVRQSILSSIDTLDRSRVTLSPQLESGSVVTKRVLVDQFVDPVQSHHLPERDIRLPDYLASRKLSSSPLPPGAEYLINIRPDITAVNGDLLNS